MLRELPGATIIADVKASQALFDRIAELGGKPLMWKTGHSLIKTKMKETGAPLAGEMSGHIFFAHDYYGFDDAHYAAVRLIRAVHVLGKSLTELRGAMPAMVNTPEMRFQVDESRKFAVIDEVLDRLEADGRRRRPHRRRARQHARRLVAAARLEHPGRAGRPRRGEGPGRARPAARADRRAARGFGARARAAGGALIRQAYRKVRRGMVAPAPRAQFWRF